MTEQTWGWTDKLELNYAPMDSTHREFVALCANLYGHIGQAFLVRLAPLIAHTVDHFELENQWMVEHQFPLVGCHVKEHDAILEIMREVGRRGALRWVRTI